MDINSNDIHFDNSYSFKNGILPIDMFPRTPEAFSFRRHRFNRLTSCGVRDIDVEG